MICISAFLCYITHHSLRMRDEVLEVKVNKIWKIFKQRFDKIEFDAILNLAPQNGDDH